MGSDGTKPRNLSESVFIWGCVECLLFLRSDSCVCLIPYTLSINTNIVLKSNVDRIWRWNPRKYQAIHVRSRAKPTSFRCKSASSSCDRSISFHLELLYFWPTKVKQTNTAKLIANTLLAIIRWKYKYWHIWGVKGGVMLGLDGGLCGGRLQLVSCLIYLRFYVLHVKCYRRGHYTEL